MAWPHSRLHTYVDNSPPVIAAADLNALQDAVIATVDATWSLKSLYIDGTGGTAVTPAQGRLYVRGGSGAPAVTLDVGGAWGAGASSAVTGAGAQDAWGEITVTAAGVPAANPRTTLTFADGTWTTTPWVMTWLAATDDGGSPVGSGAKMLTTAATDFSWDFIHTPVAGKVYVFRYVVIG